jgi:hypothetical protein
MNANDHDVRATYDEIKSGALSTYFDGCIAMGIRSRQPHEQALGYLAYNYEDAFHRPIENLMLLTVQIALSGDWYPGPCASLRRRLLEIVTEHGLDALLNELPSEERQVFTHELRSLNVVAMPTAGLD